MFQSHWIFGSAQAQQPLALRREVYVLEQGVPEDEEFDRFDGYAAHLLITDEVGPIAAARMYPSGDVTCIGRIAVAKPYRAEPYDELCLRIMLDKASSLAGSTVAARLTEAEAALYLPFGFARTGDFTQYRGAPRALYIVARDGVVWDSPCKHMKAPAE